MEMQGIQNINSSDVSSDLGVLKTESLSTKKDEQLKIKSMEETSTEEEVVAVDLSASVNLKSIEGNDSLPDLMKVESNKNFVSKAEFMAAKNKVQATEANTASAGSDANRPSFSTASE